MSHPQGRIGPVKDRSAISASPSAHPVGEQPHMDQVVTSRAPKPARPRFATPILVVALMGVLGLYISAAAAASSGGAGMGPGPGATGTAQPGNLVVTASTNGMTIAARESALLRA